MKKITLAALASFCMFWGLMAQQRPFVGDSSVYPLRKLKVEEVNLVSGYYHQTGDHAAVGGGIGSERLTDFANQIDMRFSGVRPNGVKHYLGLEFGVDHYTSASSDKIDPRPRRSAATVIDSALLVDKSTRTSASYEDIRVYPSLNWRVENPKKHWTFGMGAAYSSEYDYESRSVSANFSKSTPNANREIAFRTAAYFDLWSKITPVELRPGYATGGGGHDDDDDDYTQAPRNTYETSLTFSQVINRRLHLALMADFAYQHGYLATSFNRVFFEDGSLDNETLPSTKMKTPVGIRLHYFAGDRFIFRTYYRYYRDSWGMMAHTAGIETPVKLNRAWSISPNFRWHRQSANRYFAAYRQHDMDDKYFTSDYDMSGFDSQFYGIGLRFSPVKRLFPGFYAVESRGGFYRRSDGLQAWIVSFNLKLK